MLEHDRAEPVEVLVEKSCDHFRLELVRELGEAFEVAEQDVELALAAREREPFGVVDDFLRDVARQVLAQRVLREAALHRARSPHRAGNGNESQDPAGDPAEANAIKAVYGDRAKSIPVTSIKGSIGHTMGAAGAIESVVAVLSMYNQIIPPTLNYITPDEEIGLNIVGNVAQKADFAISTKHSFGLGGQNACLVLGRVDA